MQSIQSKCILTQTTDSKSGIILSQMIIIDSSSLFSCLHLFSFEFLSSPWIPPSWHLCCLSDDSTPPFSSTNHMFSREIFTGHTCISHHYRDVKRDVPCPARLGQPSTAHWTVYVVLPWIDSHAPPNFFFI